jgi:AraC family transcriptional regulator
MTKQPSSRLEYQRRISQAVDYINENLFTDLSLEEVAAAANFSKYHFHRVFRAITGEKCGGFIRRLRLEAVANRLVFAPHQDITSIALEYGFSSSQNLAKAFTKHFKLSPTKYREQHSIKLQSNPGTTQGNFGNMLGNNGNAWSLSEAYTVSHTQSTDRSNAMNITLKELPDYHVAYIRRLGPYGPEISETFERLAQWAGPRELLANGQMISAYWDNPEITPPEKCRADACVTVAKGTKVQGEIALQTLSGGKFAVYHVELANDEFEQAWKDLYHKWMPDSGFQPEDKPCMELYYNNPEDHPEKKWVTDICVPVKPL